MNVFRLLNKTLSVLLVFILLQTNCYAACGGRNNQVNDFSQNDCISPKSYFEAGKAVGISNDFSLKTYVFPKTEVDLQKNEKAEATSRFSSKWVLSFKKMAGDFFSRFSATKFFMTVLFSCLLSVSSLNAQEADNNRYLEGDRAGYSVADSYRSSVLSEIDRTGVMSAGVVNGLRDNVLRNADAGIVKEAVKILYEQHQYEVLREIAQKDVFSVFARSEAFFYLEKSEGFYFLSEFISAGVRDADVSSADAVMMQKALLALQDYVVLGKLTGENLVSLYAQRKVKVINSLTVLLETEGVSDAVKRSVADVVVSSFASNRDIAALATAYRDLSGEENEMLLPLKEEGSQVVFTVHSSRWLKDAAADYLKRKIAMQQLYDLSQKVAPDNFLLKFITDNNRIRHASFLYRMAASGRYSDKWMAGLLPDIHNDVNSRYDRFIKEAGRQSLGTNAAVGFSRDINDFSEHADLSSSLLSKRNRGLRELREHNDFSAIASLAVSSDYRDIRSKAVDILKDNYFYLMQVYTESSSFEIKAKASEYLLALRKHSFASSGFDFSSNDFLADDIIPLIKSLPAGEARDLFLKDYLAGFASPFTMIAFYIVLDDVSDLSDADRDWIKGVTYNEIKRQLSLALIEEQIKVYRQKHASSIFTVKDSEIMNLENAAASLKDAYGADPFSYLDELPAIKSEVNSWVENLSDIAVAKEQKFLFWQTRHSLVLSKLLMLFGLSFSVLLLPYFIGAAFKKFLKGKKTEEKTEPEAILSPVSHFEKRIEAVVSGDLNTKADMLKLKGLIDAKATLTVEQENKALRKLKKFLATADDVSAKNIAFHLYKKITFLNFSRNNSLVVVHDDLVGAKSPMEEDSAGSRLKEFFRQLKYILSGKGFLSESMIKQLSLYEGEKIKVSSDFLSLRKKIKFSNYLLSIAQYGMVIVPFFLSMFFVVPAFLNVLLIGFLVFFVGAEVLNQWLLQKIEVKDKSLGAVIRKIGLDFKISRANLPSSWHIVTGELSRWYIFQLGLTVFSITAALFFVKIAFVPFFIGLVALSTIVVFYSVFSKKGILKQQDKFLTDYQNALTELEDNVALGVDYDFDNVIAEMDKSATKYRKKSTGFSLRLFLLIKIGIPLVGVFLGFPLQGYLLSTYLYSFFGTNYFIRSVFESLFHVKMLKKLLAKIAHNRYLTKAKWNKGVDESKRKGYLGNGWQIDSMSLENFSVRLPGSDSAFILKDENITFEKGKFLRIFGASGAGKSSLAKVISSIWDNVGGSGSKMLNLKNADGEIKKVSCTPENFSLSEIRKAIKYIDMSDFPSGSTIGRLLERFEIKENAFFEAFGEVIPDIKLPKSKVLAKSISEFSHGEKLRLELILVLLFYRNKNISHLVLDEPFANLDEDSARRTFAYLKKWQDEDARRDNSDKAPCVIVIDHNLPDDIAGIDENIFIKNGAVADLKQEKEQKNVFNETNNLLGDDVVNIKSFEEFALYFDEAMVLKHMKMFGNVSADVKEVERKKQQEKTAVIDEEKKQETADAVEKDREQPPVVKEKALFGDELRDAVTALLNLGGVSFQNMQKDERWLYYSSLYFSNPESFVESLNTACYDSLLVRKIVAEILKMKLAGGAEINVLKKESSKDGKESKTEIKKAASQKTDAKKIKTDRGIGKKIIKFLSLSVLIVLLTTQSSFLFDSVRKVKDYFTSSTQTEAVVSPESIFADYSEWEKQTEEGRRDSITYESVDLNELTAIAYDFPVDSITAGENGTLTSVKAEGTFLKKGDVIAVYNNPEKDRLLGELKTATQELSFMREKLRQDELLLSQNFVASEKVEDLRRSCDSLANSVLVLQHSLKRFVMRASADGVLDYNNKFLASGSVISRGDELFSIVNPADRIMEFNVPTKEALLLGEGDTISLTVNNQHIEGVVREIRGNLTPHNSSLRISAVLHDADGVLGDEQSYVVSLSHENGNAGDSVIFPFNKYNSFSAFSMQRADAFNDFTSPASGYVRYAYRNGEISGVRIDDPVLNTQIMEAAQAKDRYLRQYEISKNIHDNTGGMSANELTISHNRYLNALSAYNALLNSRNQNSISVNADWELADNIPPAGKYVYAGERLFSYTQGGFGISVTALVKEDVMPSLKAGDTVSVYVPGKEIQKAVLVRTGMAVNGYVPFVFDFEDTEFYLPLGAPVTVLVEKSEDELALSSQTSYDPYLASGDLYVRESNAVLVSA